MPGCTEALCPLETLVRLTEPWAYAANDPARPCWTAAPVPSYAEGFAEGTGAADADGRVLPSSAFPAGPAAPHKASSSTGGGGAAYIQNPSPIINEADPAAAPSSSASASSSFGSLLLGTLLGVAVGVVSTLAWGRRQRRGEYDAVAAGEDSRISAVVAAADDGGVGSIPHSVLSAVDRGRYVSI